MFAAILAKNTSATRFLLARYLNSTTACKQYLALALECTRDMLQPTFSIRPALSVDAHGIIQLLSVLYSETEYLPLAPGDSIASPQELAARINIGNKSGSAPVFIAETQGTMVGVIFGSRGMTARTRHIMHVVVGVLQSHQGVGIGHGLMQALESLAATHHLHRMELAVHSGNTRAITLYRHMGYVQEGKKIQSVCIRNKYVDELIFAKLLQPSERPTADATAAATPDKRVVRQKKTA